VGRLPVVAGCHSDRRGAASSPKRQQQRLLRAGLTLSHRLHAPELLLGQPRRGRSCLLPTSVCELPTSKARASAQPRLCDRPIETAPGTGPAAPIVVPPGPTPAGSPPRWPASFSRCKTVPTSGASTPIAEVRPWPPARAVGALKIARRPAVLCRIPYAASDKAMPPTQPPRSGRPQASTERRVARVDQPPPPGGRHRPQAPPQRPRPAPGYASRGCGERAERKPGQGPAQLQQGGMMSPAAPPGPAVALQGHHRHARQRRATPPAGGTRPEVMASPGADARGPLPRQMHQGCPLLQHLLPAAGRVGRRGAAAPERGRAARRPLASILAVQAVARGRVEAAVGRQAAGIPRRRNCSLSCYQRQPGRAITEHQAQLAVNQPGQLETETSPAGG